MRNVWLLSLLGLVLVLVLGCGDGGGGAAGTGGVAGSGGAEGSAGSGGVQSTPIEVTEASFDCILNGTKVRQFYVKNLIGDLEGSLAVANGEMPPPYPPGTLLQLVPLEAMVKREAGFSSETRDWEFFALQVSSQGTTIVERGKDEAENAFGGNCFACHSAATDNDFVCESGNGCDPLPFGPDFIEDVQNGDARCD